MTFAGTDETRAAQWSARGRTPAGRRAYRIGGGLPSALAGSAGSHSHTAQAWRNAECANSTTVARGSDARRASSESRMYSPNVGSQRAGGGERVALSNPPGAGWA